MIIAKNIASVEFDSEALDLFQFRRSKQNTIDIRIWYFPYLEIIILQLSKMELVLDKHTSVELFRDRKGLFMSREFGPFLYLKSPFQLNWKF